MIALPFRIADPAEIHAQENLFADANLRGLDLLLAEDNELNAEIAQALLTDAGAKVIVVSDGKEAVDRFASEEASLCGRDDAPHRRHYGFPGPSGRRRTRLRWRSPSLP